MTVVALYLIAAGAFMVGLLLGGLLALENRRLRWRAGACRRRRSGMLAQ